MSCPWLFLAALTAPAFGTATTTAAAPATGFSFGATGSGKIILFALQNLFFSAVSFDSLGLYMPDIFSIYNSFVLSFLLPTSID